MNNKLTLKLEQEIIERGKAYATQHNTTLSALVEGFIKRIALEPDGTKPADGEITPLIKSLTGILDLSGNPDDKKIYTDHLLNKYK